ncbi:Heparan-sulfate 6-O-sulfotransferase 3 [Hypsibius exemplaris]|uniref:Heparan-sulfate 6-O-sulfotransferase n=1 Tax=Hypsibius exemplaris TaxID=2072580 RepID=A0A1W0X1G7_HYPEX|nr:Heparan-sulfate 6-O-sulfotransferase 3 [Hypsibius exemplaris]
MFNMAFNMQIILVLGVYIITGRLLIQNRHQNEKKILARALAQTGSLGYICAFYGEFRCRGTGRSMWMPSLWGRRILVVAAVALGCLQFFQGSFLHCPGWICGDNSSVSGGHAEFGPRPGEAYLSVAETARARGRGKPKVQPEVFGHSRRNGVSLWDSTGLTLRKDVTFRVNGSDVLVYLHIQKTGGTAFGKNMVTNLADPFSGKKTCSCKATAKRCKCYRPGSNTKEWLFSRFSTGWKCGLHADWTELTNCVDHVMEQRDRSQRRRYFYMTMLREPYRRYLSEFLHVQRGATWRNSRHWCGGRFALSSEIRPCFNGDTWDGVTFDEFLTCPNNLAANRQTRMLADLQLVGCYNTTIMEKTQHDEIMLNSAKENLRNMAFFGIIEELDDTQTLFERTFGLRFDSRLNGSHEARGENFVLEDKQRAAYELKNALDTELYKFAKELFDERVRTVGRLFQQTITSPEENSVPDY